MRGPRPRPLRLLLLRRPPARRRDGTAARGDGPRQPGGRGGERAVRPRLAAPAAAGAGRPVRRPGGAVPRDAEDPAPRRGRPRRQVGSSRAMTTPRGTHPPTKETPHDLSVYATTPDDPAGALDRLVAHWHPGGPGRRRTRAGLCHSVVRHRRLPAA